MEWWLVLTLILGSFITLLLVGVPVAFSFLFVNLAGAFFLWNGEAGMRQLVLSVMTSVSNFGLLPIPAFVLMGEIMFRSNVGRNMIEAIDKLLGRLPGRLSLLAVMGGTVFASLSGSSMASTAMLGSVLMPEMEKRGYQKPMSLGPILGSGGLAIMVPPTALGVLLASLGRIPVGKFMLAIILPGVLMAAIFAVYIVGRCALQPHLAPPYALAKVPVRERVLSFTKYVLPLGLILFLVIGLMTIGVATPTESAGLGAIGCLVLAALYRGLSWRTMVDSIAGTLSVTTMMLVILTGSTAFSQILVFSGATNGLVDLVTGASLQPWAVLLIMQFILIMMGCFMEPLSIMMVTLPVFMPIIKVLNFDPLWFGAIMLLNMEMATITPPFGLGLFAMKGVAPKGTTMGQIYAGAMPFVSCDALAMTLIMIFPSIALWLPSLGN